MEWAFASPWFGGEAIPLHFIDIGVGTL